MPDISAVFQLLVCPTPASWVQQAKTQLDLLLIDHAHCEKKAASSAINLLFRYPDREKLVYHMSRLAREELRHFEQVIALLKKRGVAFCHLLPASYGSYLWKAVVAHEPQKLVDTLIVGALIEARSCERFALIAPHFPPEIQKFYQGLLESEARHFQIYLQLAEEYSGPNFTQRVQLLAAHEAAYIQKAELDTEVRFHSGGKGMHAHVTLECERISAQFTRI